jgi:NitT/TauT family transport system substrate-binding protein
MVVRRHFIAGSLTGAALAALPRGAFAADVVRFATAPLDAGAEAYYGTDMGFFRDAGIDAQVAGIANGGAIASAVASGAVDIGFANVVSIATAYKHGIPLTLVAPASLYLASDPTSVLMVPNNSPAKTAKDLNGKTFAASGLGTITEFAPRYWIDKNGGDSTTVKFVEVPPAEDYAAIDARRLDAVNVAEPQITEMKPIGRILGKPYDALGEGFMIAGYFSTRTWADANPDLARRFVQTLRETALWANKNQDKSADVLAKYTRLDPKLIRSGNRAHFGEAGLTPQMLQSSIDLAARYKLFDGGPFPASELIYQPKK